MGTVAMDLVWYRRARRDGSDDGPLEWEFGGVSTWDDVSAPGQVAQSAMGRLVGSDLPDSWAGPSQNAVHWGTGIVWGAQLSLVVGSAGRRSFLGGLALGPVAWLTSYVVLGLLGVYQPIWEYERSDLTKDLSAHMVFGTATGVTLVMLDRCGARR